MKAEHAVDILLDALPQSLRLSVTFVMTDETTNVLPALVTKEIKPDSLPEGAWRITLFNQKMDPLGHVNFDIGELNALTLSAVTRSETFPWLDFLGVYNNSGFPKEAVNIRFGLAKAG